LYYRIFCQKATTMSDLTLLDIHRRMMAAPTDQDVCWWYFGTTFAQLDGLPEIPCLQAETIMMYRTETLSPESYRIHWRELGYFRDPVTGLMARSWLNPITGAVVATPNSFMEGPSHHTITLQTGQLLIGLEQAHAIVRSIGVTVEHTDKGRIQLTQEEHKLRGFPLPDGTMPGADSDALSEAKTVLTMFASQADIERPGSDPAPCSGVYSFELSKLPPWMGFDELAGGAVVRGVMHKTSVQDHLNMAAWQQLRATFPSYFTGDVLTPPW